MSTKLTLLEDPRTSLQGFTTLTADDIANSATLQSLNALEGDVVNPDRKLVRVVSDAEDAEQLNDPEVSDSPMRILDEFDLADSYNLRQLDAEVGDMVKDNKLYKKGSNAFWKNFKYQMAKESNFSGNLSTILEANYPLGEIVFGGEDFFNYVPPSKEFMDADVEQRKAMIAAKKAEELEAYREELGIYDPESSLTAAITKNVVDPTTLISGPLGLAAKGAFFGTLAAGESVTEDIAKNEDIDPVKAAQQFALGAAGPVAAPVAQRTVSSIMNAVPEKPLSKLDAKKIKEVQKVVNEKLTFGATYKEAFDEAKEELGMTNAEVMKAALSAGGKVLIQDPFTFAKKQFQNIVAHDSTVGRKVSGSVNDWLLSIENALGRISPSLKGKLQRHDQRASLRTAEYENRATPALKTLKSLDEGTRKRVDSYLFSGRFDEAKKVIDEYAPEGSKAFGELQVLLKEIAEDLQIKTNENYFPRLVKDIQGLREYLGRENLSQLEKEYIRVAKAKGVEVDALSPIEKSMVVNEFLSSKQFDPNKVSGSTRNLKQRILEDVEQEMLPFYENSADTLYMYLRNSANAIEVRRFFGQKAVDDKGNINEFRINDSIGATVQRLADEGVIDQDRILEANDLLTARFVGGEQNLGGALGAIRDLGYIGTLTNVVSAVSNMADLALPAYKHGLKNVVKSMFGPKEFDVVDIGVDSIAAEFTDASKLSKLLRRMFRSKLTQYHNIDKFAKETSVQAGINKARASLKEKGGEEAFRAKYRDIFEYDTDKLIEDLQAGRKTDLTKEFAFSILAETQPISRSSMPKNWNANPNFRILYMMKSFAVRNYNLVQEDIIEDFKKGKKVEAVKKSALLAGYLTASGVPINIVKDMMLNREVDVNQIPNEAVDAMLGAFSVSDWTLGQLERGQGTEAVQDYLVAPLPYFELATDAITGNLSERDVQKIPIVGRLLYHWGLKGD